MDVFRLRDKIICEDYARYTSSFIQIADDRIHREVEEKFKAGLLWPEPLLQLNPSFAHGGSIDELVENGILHPLCGEIFRLDKSADSPEGSSMFLYRHQREAIEEAQKGNNYVLTTGTGSGKSLSYVIPIVNHVLEHGTGTGIQAIIVYPMNALANSQELELEKFLKEGKQEYPVSFRRYTGQEREEAREEIISNPPDILLTNYVMLELILTRPYERKLVDAARGLKFLVFDELHTYRGRQGADVAMLIRRLRETLCGHDAGRGFQCIGTSATLAGPGTFEEKRRDVAAVASKLFGCEVASSSIIVETLCAETENANRKDFPQELTSFLKSGDPLPTTYKDFVFNPLVIWIEKNVGVEIRDGRLERCTPRPLKGRNGLAESLADTTGLEVAQCVERIKEALLLGSTIKKPSSNKPVFAFKLHQFVSKGDTVYATIEPEDSRFITLFGQKLAPGREGEVPLFPLSFCRECGKEYYSVTIVEDKEAGTALFSPLNPSEVQSDDIKGYLFVDTLNPWPSDPAEQADRLPEDWLEEKNGQLVVAKGKKKHLPMPWYVLPDGSASQKPEPGSVQAWFLLAPLPFCPQCGVSYGPRLGDFSKLATLGTEGRSTATTILSMSTVNHLCEEPDLRKIARKLLCFSDNRQDASMQSGHFNDFVQIGLIRSALYNALEKAGDKGVTHERLPQQVFEALGLGYENRQFPRKLFAQNPNAKYHRASADEQAFRAVLEYLIYSDLRRGWRIVAPNLEQCGLLEISYLGLGDICADEDLWADNPYLAKASAEMRKQICLALLDFLRMSLAINAECLEKKRQEEIIRQSQQHLIEPWCLEHDEELLYSTMAYPRPRRAGDSASDLFLSPRGKFGLWLKNRFFRVKAEELFAIIGDLLTALCTAGVLDQNSRGYGEPGYQISASAMLWKAGDGTRARHDRFRIRHARGEYGRTNPFFVDMYRNIVKQGYNLRSCEHTAQVPSDIREQREEEFREARLPVLYCSPTMELGVDISQLNAVGMRNVPPTPANYAQRSGRAGRSGQPALIITYCAQGNSHDQHFFRSPEQMVAGSVSTPRIDLANEDLIRSHVHALWLAASGLDLKKTLRDLVDISGDVPSLALVESVLVHLDDPVPRKTAAIQAKNILNELSGELEDCGWYNELWLEKIFNTLPQEFEQSCERWRNLYRAAVRQRDQQTAISNDLLRSRKDRDAADRLRSDAIQQINLLIDGSNTMQADFYSYRYFASEGFLPGYNFPRLPLSAFIPGRRENREREEYISRSRFLAISEFGPESVIYHEGAKYSIKRVIMDAEATDSLAVTKLKLCEQCGWLETDPAKDLCDMCGSQLPPAMENLFRMRNVATIHRARINSDEEERLRYGYRIVSGYRFEEHGNMPSYREAVLGSAKGEALLGLKYGHGATLWRMNMGWLNSTREQVGFLLDKTKGTWIGAKQLGSAKGKATDQELSDVTRAGAIERVIPYVEDRKNCLVMEPRLELTHSQMVSLQSALKQAIQQCYQLEDFELGTEVMPTQGTPKTLLFIEAAEGGAGVLRHLVDDAGAMSRVAATALEICHFDADGNDLGKAEHASEQCVAACYDCLMNYGNQRVHKDLDRHAIRELLLAMSRGKLITAGASASSVGQLEELKKCCDSALERKWLELLHKHDLRLPDAAQYRLECCKTVADFWYDKSKTAIYIDGPWHEFPDRRQRDAEQEECLEDMGITVLRFAADEQWLAEINNHPDLFGKVQ